MSDSISEHTAESFPELFESFLSENTCKVGDLIRATVLSIDKDFVVVDAGLKSDGYINSSEFRTQDGTIEAAVGEEVEVVLEQIDNGIGNTLLSRERARHLRKWAELEQALESKEIIQANVVGRVKGGFTVLVDVVRAFLPFSLADVRPILGETTLEGEQIECRVIKMDNVRNNIVVSRRAVLEEQNIQERREIFERMEKDAVFTGVVKNITDYGAFVDLGGIDGLLHITDIAWERVMHPSEALTIGDELEVVVLKYDEERARVSLGRKQLLPDPWDGLEIEFPVGAKVRGRVTKLADYGCFVEIKDKVEGLVHTSELDWTSKNVHAKKVVQIDEEIEVVVLDINKTGRRISLSLKQASSNPWESFAAMHKKGEKITGKVKSITDFGIFIGLDSGVDGLVHLGDFDWTIPGEEAIKKYKKGDEVTAVLLSVKAEERRISLGIKQLEQDSFSVYLADNGRGNIVEGEITHIDSDGVTVALADGVDGFIRKQELADEAIDDIAKYFAVGQKVMAKIINADRKTRAFHLSVRAKGRDDEKAAVENYTAQTKQEGVKLGTLLKGMDESDTENSDDSAAT